MARFGRWLLEIFDPPELVYRVTFGDGLPNIITNTMNTETQLLCTASAVTSQNNAPPIGPLASLTGGLVLSITRPADVDVAVICTTALPKFMKRFRLRASGTLGTGQNAFDPQMNMSQWAPLMVAHGHSGPDTTGFIPVGATQQVRYGPLIALGAARGTDVTPAATAIPDNQAYLRSSERTFNLEADINCHNATGTSRLTTPRYVWPPRYWSHQYLSPVDYSPSGFDRAGVGLAITEGIGAAAATFTRFEVWEWKNREPWWKRIAVALFGQ